MAVPKTKKQIDLIAENQLLKEQRNLMHEIEKQIPNITKVSGKYAASVKNQLNDLIKEKEFRDQLLKSQLLFNTILTKQVLLDKDELKTQTAIVFWKRISSSIDTSSLEAHLQKVRADKSVLDILKNNISKLVRQTELLHEQETILERIARKSDLASALGLSKYTSGIQSLTLKLAILQGKNVKFATTLLKIFDEWYYPIVLVYSILHKVWGVFKDMDKSFFNFRKQWSIVREDSLQFETRMYSIVKNTAQLGVYFDDVVEAMTKLGKESGSLFDVTDEMVQNVAILNKQLGISADTSTRFLKVMASVSQETIGAQSGMLGIAKEMANAYKVPLNEVMDDIAKASASSYGYLSKNPLELIKAAVEARRFGTSLSSLANTSKSLLSFTDSMESEMEASVLIGRSINLQNARRLAYNKDFVGLNREIVRLAKEFNYNQMDPFQAAAFAKALGKSEEELAKILQSSQEENDLIKRANELAKQGHPELLDQIKARNTLIKLSQDELRDKGKIAEKNFINLRNQERLAAVTDAWKRIFVDISEKLIPIIDLLLKMAVPISNLIGETIKWSMKMGLAQGILKTISLTFLGIGKLMTSIGAIFFKSSSFLGKFFAGGSKFLGIVGESFGGIARVAGFLSRLAIPFSKWIPVIGWIIMGIQFVYDLSKRIYKIWTSKDMNIGQKLLQSVLAVGYALYDAAVKPFVDLFKWIWNNLGGGTVRVFTDAISKVYDWAVNKFKSLWESVSGFFSSSSNPKVAVDQKANTIAVPLDKPIPDGTIKSYRELESLPVDVEHKNDVKVQPVNDDAAKVENILSSIDRGIRDLRQDLVDGKIAVNIDGQLVNTTTNRNLKFRGNYGAIK